MIELTQFEKIQLAKEVEAAQKAKEAFDSYFAEFFEEKEAMIIQAFRATPAGDKDTIVNIHLMFKALDAHKHDLITKIETGKMATIQLNAAEETMQ